MPPVGATTSATPAVVLTTTSSTILRAMTKLLLGRLKHYGSHLKEHGKRSCVTNVGKYGLITDREVAQFIIKIDCLGLLVLVKECFNGLSYTSRNRVGFEKRLKHGLV
ncbi:hypothetical protein LXL04_023147 [Taraxacum kok-saghyz]